MKPNCIRPFLAAIAVPFALTLPIACAVPSTDLETEEQVASSNAEVLTASELAAYGFSSMTFGGDRVTGKLTRSKCALTELTLVAVDAAGGKVTVTVKLESHDPTNGVAIYGVNPLLNGFYDLPLSTPSGLAPKKITTLAVRWLWTVSISGRKPPNPLCS